MSTTFPTASSAGKSTGRKSSDGKQVLGKTTELWEFVYKSHTKDQADMYLRTTEAIADYVGVEYSRDMRMLVKKGTTKTFTKPIPPKGSSPPAAELEEYKIDSAIHRKAVKEYNDHKAKVFVVILGQCSPQLKSRLVNEIEYNSLEDNDDVVGLLNKLKEMAFSTAGVEHPCWALQAVLKRLTAINQAPNESVANYYRRFLALTEVTEAHWGPLVPTKMVTSTITKTDARQQTLSMIFLAGADKKRFGPLTEGLHNSYLAKKDDYPTSLDTTLQLLSHYQGHTNDPNGGDKNTEGSSFAQKRKLKKVRCYNCNELGHYKTDCPLLTEEQANAQLHSDSESDEDNSH
jgi:hypothetical protein